MKHMDKPPCAWTTKQKNENQPMKKTIQYHFDVDDAMTHGVEAAVLLSNLRFWVFTNKAKKRNFANGKYWTYNSAEALTRMYPFWNRRKIARLLQKLEEAGAIESMQVSRGGDQTKWYSINHDEQKPLDKNDQCPLDRSVQPLDKNDQSLYKQIQNTDQKPDKKTCFDSVVDDLDGFKDELKTSPEFSALWGEWVEYRKAKKKPMSNAAKNRLQKKLNQHTLEECTEAIDIAIQSDWTGIFPKKLNGSTNGKQAAESSGEDIDSLI